LNMCLNVVANPIKNGRIMLVIIANPKSCGVL